MESLCNLNYYILPRPYNEFGVIDCSVTIYEAAL